MIPVTDGLGRFRQFLEHSQEGGGHEKDIDLLSRPLCSVRRPDCCRLLRGLIAAMPTAGRAEAKE